MDDTLKEILEEVGKRPLRSSIITSAALMDSMLESLLKKYLVESSNFRELFSGQGALSTFSAKITMCHALGLISKELRDDLNSYRKIRNRCAHDLTIGEETRNMIKSISKDFNLLHEVIKIGDSEDLQIYTALEFMIIFVCLIKRINNVQKLSAFPMEAHDNYLGFDDADYDFLNRFGEAIKK